MRFIDEHKQPWGVEPIGRVLQFAPATYDAATSRPPSARKVRDATLDDTLKEAIERIWTEHFGVYGAAKGWAQLKREGTRVARCTVERLLRALGLRGVVWKKPDASLHAASGPDHPPAHAVPH